MEDSTNHMLRICEMLVILVVKLWLVSCDLREISSSLFANSLNEMLCKDPWSKFVRISSTSTVSVEKNRAVKIFSLSVNLRLKWLKISFLFTCFTYDFVGFYFTLLFRRIPMFKEFSEALWLISVERADDFVVELRCLEVLRIETTWRMKLKQSLRYLTYFYFLFFCCCGVSFKLENHSLTRNSRKTWGWLCLECFSVILWHSGRMVTFCYVYTFKAQASKQQRFCVLSGEDQLLLPRRLLSSHATSCSCSYEEVLRRSSLQVFLRHITYLRGSSSRRNSRDGSFPGDFLLP